MGLGKEANYDMIMLGRIQTYKMSNKVETAAVITFVQDIQCCISRKSKSELDWSMVKAANILKLYRQDHRQKADIWGAGGAWRAAKVRRCWEFRFTRSCSSGETKWMRRCLRRQG